VSATTCSDEARALCEPLAGTTSRALVWVGVEQSGPWGPRPVTRPADSHLPADLFDITTTVGALSDVTAVLLRPPGHHADTHTPSSREIVMASLVPDTPWVASARLTDSELRGVDLPKAAEQALHGTLPDFLLPRDQPLVLVCTNARRDQCCAVRGRPVAGALAAALPGRVWECSHLGGHRFAPCVLALPHGAVYSPRTDAGVDELARAITFDQIAPEQLRGLTQLSAPEQVADAHLRRLHHLTGSHDVRILSTTPSDTDHCRIDALTPLGRCRVQVSRHELSPRRESCRAEPVPGHTWVVDDTRSLEPLTRPRRRDLM